MNTVIESLLSIAIPAVLLIWAALSLAAKEDRETHPKSDTERAMRRHGQSIVLDPDPDAHLGRSGTE